ncbi:hypothetical protein NHX12_001223 [Muraenolepis orangiensis]|uniref:SHSP domain-containing protein n=1 Tax=Muraenolepis orangiensis TaxID=630683 RepID=A0A9Q0E1P0_9TELE|nr:hypothetical protein NHX12_001223 [Muraenolepis orangiensis]
MDFVLPATLPATGISWEKFLPPLIPRLNGIYGQTSELGLLIPDNQQTSCTQVNCDPSGFRVQVDVKLFSPEDLLVKVTGDFVEVQGKHEEKKKDGSGTMTRQFSRRYRIPEGVDTLALESAVSPEGILMIYAPMLQTQG